MKDLTEARKLLEVDEKATKDDIIKRYDVILKKYRNTDEIDGVKLQDLYEAYNLLMGYDLSDKPEMQPEPPSFLSSMSARLFKLDSRKVDNFLHYNKWKILAGIVAIILIVSTIKSIVTNVPVDFYMTTVGEISIENSEKVDANLKALIPTIKGPQVEQMFIRATGVNQGQQSTPTAQTNEKLQQTQQLQQGQQGEQDYALNMKLTVMITAGELDLLLVDNNIYQNYGQQGTFETVDQISKDLGMDLPKDESLKVETMEGETGIYGVDVTNSEFLKENGITGKKIIATIRINAKHRDTALQVYKKIFETIKK